MFDSLICSILGLVYNTYNWEDREDFKLFDSKHEILQEIVLFVDKAIRFISLLILLILFILNNIINNINNNNNNNYNRHGASVLLFSTRGIGRCTAAVCAYLMFKYG